MARTLTLAKSRMVSMREPDAGRVMEVLRQDADDSRTYSLADVRVGPDGSLLNIETAENKHPRFTADSFADLCSVIDAPVSWMRSEGMQSPRSAKRMSDAINDHLHAVDGRFKDFHITVNMRSGAVYGIQRPGTKSFGNRQAFEATQQLIGDDKNLKDMGVTQFSLADGLMRVNINQRGVDFSNDIQRAFLKRGDALQSGVSIVNSPLALQPSFAAHSFVERLVCENGMVMMQKGQGGTVMLRGKSVEHRIGQVMRKAAVEVVDAYPMIDRMRFSGIADEELEPLADLIARRISRASAARVFQNAESEVRTNGSQLRRTDKEDAYCVQKRPVSVYDIWNGITFEGHHAKTIQSRRKIEAFAGAFATEWSDVVEPEGD